MLSARLITLFFVGLFLSLQSFAFKVPNLSGPVIDEPGLLSTNAKANLDQTIRELKQRNGPQVQVFVTSSLQDEEIASVAIQIFDQWKLGDAKKSNGILFLIAPAEKKMRIEVGQGPMPSRTPFLRVISLAFRAASRARAASMICRR